MKRHLPIFFIALWLTGCSAYKIIQIDDAYYYPDPAAYTTGSGGSGGSGGSKGSEGSEGLNSSLEYLNVQDTTVTIRIKK